MKYRRSINEYIYIRNGVCKWNYNSSHGTFRRQMAAPVLAWVHQKKKKKRIITVTGLMQTLSNVTGPFDLAFHLHESTITPARLLFISKTSSADARDTSAVFFVNVTRICGYCAFIVSSPFSLRVNPSVQPLYSTWILKVWKEQCNILVYISNQYITIYWFIYIDCDQVN